MGDKKRQRGKKCGILPHFALCRIVVHCLCKGRRVGTALAEAFDHADVSLIDLLDLDGDAAPIGADVEEIERLPKPIVIIKPNVGGCAPSTLPVAVESPEDPVQVGPSFQQVDAA